MNAPKVSAARAKPETPAGYYPLLLGVYPLVALLAGNIGQLRLADGLRAGLLSLAFSALLYAVFSRLLRNAARGALVTTLVLALFFSYGHVYGALEEAGSALGRHRFLAPLWGGLLLAGGFGLLRLRRVPAAVTRALNLVSVALLIFPLFTIGRFAINAEAMRRQSQSALAASDGQAGLSSAQKPDVYYIILDGYTREDILRKDYQFDNSAFLNELRGLGFVIPDCAQSNYAWTPLSLSSSLQMDYLLTLDGKTQKGDEHLDYLLYEDYIQHNPVRRNLEALGYNTVAFDTGYPFTTISDAAYYLTPESGVTGGIAVTEFEVLFLRTTALRLVNEGSAAFLAPLFKEVKTPEQGIYERVTFMLDTLDRIDSAAPAPRFVFAHVPVPHAPFVFTREGEYRLISADDGGYQQAVEYVNRRVLAIVRHILETSSTPPIIVLQADHGWTWDARMPILNAYYLPDGGGAEIYPTITPVNTFRVIFNRYFGGNYERLDDVSYLSTEEAQLKLEVVPPSCVSTAP